MGTGYRGGHIHEDRINLRTETRLQDTEDDKEMSTGYR